MFVAQGRERRKSFQEKENDDETCYQKETAGRISASQRPSIDISISCEFYCIKKVRIKKSIKSPFLTWWIYNVIGLENIFFGTIPNITLVMKVHSKVLPENYSNNRSQEQASNESSKEAWIKSIKLICFMDIKSECAYTILNFGFIRVRNFSLAIPLSLLKFVIEGFGIHFDLRLSQERIIQRNILMKTSTSSLSRKF